jgi:hypothetical protein
MKSKKGSKVSKHIALEEPTLFVGENFKVMWPQSQIDDFLSWFSESVFDDEVGIGDKSFILYHMQVFDAAKPLEPLTCVYLCSEQKAAVA